jgi:hypothetical protein
MTIFKISHFHLNIMSANINRQYIPQNNLLFHKSSEVNLLKLKESPYISFVV